VNYLTVMNLVGRISSFKKIVLCSNFSIYDLVGAKDENGGLRGCPPSIRFENGAFRANPS